MKNITLSIPEDLLDRSREYAEKHGTSLNEFIRALLRQTVTPPEGTPVQKLIRHTRRIKVSTKNWKWSRTELYDRQILS
ncbi:MAG: ribbon-helix-helix protein, CopG family [Saprospiraceae bacterium]|nr:ribbon-helix-helix protein, CopG family [Saprospiraceae bacterium]